jgi:hypothetical protein
LRRFSGGFQAEGIFVRKNCAATRAIPNLGKGRSALFDFPDGLQGSNALIQD